MAALKVTLYSNEGKAIGEQELSPKVFGVALKPALVHEVVVAVQNASRETISHTKTRGEVRGGGIKPWKQKHTGRARHGSIRSPIWVGGGVVFGPRNTRVWETKVNKKAKVAALKMVLSQKVTDGKLVVLDTLDIKDYKTKAIASVLKSLPSASKKTLIALPQVAQEAWKSVANLQKVEISRVDSLNVIDVLNHPFMVTTAAGIASLTKQLS